MAMRPFSTTPIGKWVTARRATIGGGGIWIGLAMSGMSWWFTLPLLVLIFVFLLWLANGAGHGRFLAATRFLHARLRWFEADAITWFHPDQAAELQAALTQAKVHVHELQAGAVRSIDDLQRELERRFVAPAWPKQPVARCLAILERLPQRPRGVHAVVWPAADDCVANDAEVRELLTRWTGTMAQSTPHVLLFLGRPRAPTGPASTPSPCSPATAAATPGAERAWWQPRPGELVD